MCLEDEYMKIQKMREERQSDNSVFMQFVHNSRQYNDYVFCFYEGEDGKYYDSRIRQLFGNKICTYTVRGKKNVLKLFDKIQRDDYYEDVCTMFFVDSDYDEALSQERKSDKIFETPCYSMMKILKSVCRTLKIGKMTLIVKYLILMQCCICKERKTI